MQHSPCRGLVNFYQSTASGDEVTDSLNCSSMVEQVRGNRPNWTLATIMSSDDYAAVISTVGIMFQSRLFKFLNIRV